MHDDIRNLFEQCLHHRGLAWLSSNGAATHVRGGILDFFWGPSSHAIVSLQLHNGSDCRLAGCRHPACGDMYGFTGSHDLDHFAWTFQSAFKHVNATKPASHVKFSKSIDAWTAAVALYGRETFEMLSLDIETSFQSQYSFPNASRSDSRAIVNSCALIWEVIMVMVGYAAGLLTVRPHLRTPKVPHAVRSAFNGLVRACRFTGGEQSDLVDSVEEARDAYRAAVRDHKQESKYRRSEKYLELCRSNGSEADVFLAKCLRRNKLGLPDFMVSEEGIQLMGHEVLEGAADYIASHQDMNPFADVAHRLTVESGLVSMRAYMRRVVHQERLSVHNDVTSSMVESALKQIDKSAECRGLPYATLFVDVSEHEKWLSLMHGLAFPHGISPRVWTKQDLYHTLKPGRSPQAFSSYRVLGLNTAQGRLQEEIWMLKHPELWEKTGGFQEGRSQCLIVVAADFCVAALRIAHGLPYATCYSDRKEAFDTQWRAPMLLKDGSDDGKYDVDSARQIFDAVSSGSCGWDSAMQQASSDTTRLILLDLASSIRRSMRSFVDDTRVPVCSHGHAAAAIQLLDTVASEEQYMYKAGKCKIVANGFVHRKPISLQGSLVEYSDNAVQLGCCVDSKYDASAHLSLILTKGRQKMAQLQSDMLHLGLPMQALMAAVFSRVQPAATYGMELVVHLPGFEKQLNGLQATWMKKLDRTRTQGA
eukprot:s223_g19.t1